MSRILASPLDYARDAYDKAFRDVVNQIRGRIRKQSDASTEEMELMAKWLPEELEHWAQQNKKWTRKDFEESRWAPYAIIDWSNTNNKLRLWADAQFVLSGVEEEMMISWKK